MNGHVFDDLPLLLTGEADRATVAAVTAHLRECDDCRDELISAVAAHAALTSAVKFAADLVEPQPLGVSNSVPGDAPPAPDLSALFAEIRLELAADAGPAEPHHPGSTSHRARAGAPRPTAAHRRRNWIAAAAAVVVLAGGGGYLATQTGSSGPPSRNLALAAYGEGTTPASVKLIGDDKMSLDASSLPQLATGSYYEVWLTNGARTAMAPVGVLDADRTARITVPASEMSSYAAIEVSVQKTSGVGSYSGDSVLRGVYA